MSARIDRVEDGINETRDAVNQLTNQFQKLNICKCDIFGETGHSKDPGSEFGGINNPAIKALGWKTDKPSNFAIKGNSKHITDSLGWYTDIPVTLKDKEGVSEPNKNQFRIKLYGKVYIIPTFSKASVVKDLPKKDQKSSRKVPFGSQVSANSPNLTSEEDKKKSA
ncbi:hypothetical protein C1645_741514 [Glomus cerebriforme]|uniref:Uncharacterized protein n=1 Tax=Glomus cerebriforme TaxID=658196 RepID=A0A397SN89_9GLOM|nr:hypothetical protein C1645_741514 [Glomus cerebriforme]